MKRHAWIERSGATGVVVMDLAALAAEGIVPGPDGCIRCPLDVHGALGFSREAADMHTGITLSLLCPPGPR